MFVMPILGEGKFKNVVVADSLKVEFGSFFNILGVAVEINDYQKFRQRYFEVIYNLKSKYNLANLPKIVKKKIVSKYIPSYNQRDFIKDIVEELIFHETVSFIQITETYIKEEEIIIPFSHKKINRCEFVRNYLSHYYPLVPVWKYFKNRSNPTKTVAMDHIDGKISLVWSEVGRQAEKLFIVPHGDETYPGISLCDLICEYVRRMVKEIRAKEIENFFKRELGIDYLKADFVSDLNLLAPKYPHSINPYNFYPHPIIFIYYSDIGFKQDSKRIIEDSGLFKEVLEVAENIGGCATFFDPVNHQPILKDGDIIICLDEESQNKAKVLQKLNKLEDLKILSPDEFWDLVPSQR